MSGRMPVEMLPHGEGLPLPAYATAGTPELDLAAASMTPLDLAAGRARAGADRHRDRPCPRASRGKCGRARAWRSTRHHRAQQPGTIDSDYRGEIGVILTNHGRERHHHARRTHRPARHRSGMCRCLAEVASLPASARGTGGFGSTGELKARMLKLSKKLLFAIEAVLDIAYNAGAMPVQAGEITRRHGIPRRYLEQVMQQLVRAGILAGVRGPRGGYRLARERRRISLGEIVRVVRSLDGGDDPLNEEAGAELGKRVVRPLVAGAAGRAHAPPRHHHH